MLIHHPLAWALLWAFVVLVGGVILVVEIGGAV